jgi:hypothetical protein
MFLIRHFAWMRFDEGKWALQMTIHAKSTATIPILPRQSKDQRRRGSAIPALTAKLALSGHDSGNSASGYLHVTGTEHPCLPSCHWHRASAVFTFMSLAPSIAPSIGTEHRPEGDWPGYLHVTGTEHPWAKLALSGHYF